MGLDAVSRGASTTLMATAREFSTETADNAVNETRVSVGARLKRSVRRASQARQEHEAGQVGGRLLNELPGAPCGAPGEKEEARRRCDRRCGSGQEAAADRIATAAAEQQVIGYSTDR